MRHRLLAFVAALTIVTPLVQIWRRQGMDAAAHAVGDPDLQGAYSNDDETGIPLERPAEFAGRTIADITPAEMQRNQPSEDGAVQ